MYLLWIFGLMVIVATYVVANAPSIPTQAERQNANEAAQMVVYHEATNAVCTNTPAICAGTLEIPAANVLAEMSPSISGGTNYNNGKFRSFADSGAVITIHNDINTALGTALHGAKFLQTAREIGQELNVSSGGRSVAGNYDAASDQVVSTTGFVASVPGSIAGVTIEDESPVLVRP